MSITNIIKNNKNVNINIYKCKNKKCSMSDSDTDDEEEFKRIDGYDNYSISNQGRVRNDSTNHILKPNKNKKGYFRVGLSKNGKSKTHSVHRLIGLAFLENPNNKEIVDHIDGDPTNNNISNLRWATGEQNAWNTKSSNPYGKGVYKTSCPELYNGEPYFYSTICHKGKKHRLGIFKTAEEASIVYEAKAKELFGEFYRVPKK